MDILGRDGELARIDAWLGHAADQPPAADAVPPLLVIQGVPGIGKTTLWAEAIRRASALHRRVLSCRPVPSDAGLPHVGLADLLHPVPDNALDMLPRPQRRALAVALLRQEAEPGDLDPRAVGTGLAGLLGALAEDGPLLLAVDDAQWMDPASARSLAFALRRLGGRPVAALAAIRLEESASQPIGEQLTPGFAPPGKHRGGFATVESALDSPARHHLDVGPLTVAAVHQLFRQRLAPRFPARCL